MSGYVFLFGLGSFVLGDSCEPKNTLNILDRCKNLRIEIFEKLKSVNPSFSLYTSSYEEDLSYLNNQEQNLFFATLKNRDLLEKSLVSIAVDK